MLYRGKSFCARFARGIIFGIAVFALCRQAFAVGPAPVAAGSPAPAVAPLILSGRQSERPPGTYSAGVGEIIKLLDAKIERQVIVAYIQNSTIAYDPDAGELIALKEHGGSTEMLMALLHRGDELRIQLASGRNAANPPAPVLAPPYIYAPQPAGPPYPEVYPDASGESYAASDDGYAVGWSLGFGLATGSSAYRTYRYDRGRWYCLDGQARNASIEHHRDWNSASPAVDRESHPVSATTAHSGGARSSGRSGGRSGGRSR